ncbi:hypothetical protein D3C79_1094430 [compost metagenome]
MSYDSLPIDVDKGLSASDGTTLANMSFLHLQKQLPATKQGIVIGSAFDSPNLYLLNNRGKTDEKIMLIPLQTKLHIEAI